MFLTGTSAIGAVPETPVASPPLPRGGRPEQAPFVLARSGPLELRLAATRAEIRGAQRLRFAVFYEEGAAQPDAHSAATNRDECPFDPACDHLIVVDRDRADPPGAGEDGIVGTYRLLRCDAAARHGGFYSATEFDIGALLRRHPGKRFLELGRSCVHRAYRSKRVIDLLWHGITLYAARHGTDVLIGCASLPGTGAHDLSLPLSFAYHFAAADAEWQVGALPGRGTRMDLVGKGMVDPRRAMAALPPLIKAYVRVGGRFATEAVVDHQFGTTDLFTVLPLAAAKARYLARFGAARLPEPPGSTLAA